MKPFVHLVLLSTCLVGRVVEASDWHYAGFVGGPGVHAHAFFDQEGIIYPTNSSARAWVKTISEVTIAEFTKSHNELVTNKAAAKVSEGYVPRFVNLPSVKKEVQAPETKDLAIDLISYEVVANESDVPEINKLYFEIDCEGSRIRILDGVFYSADGLAEHKSPKLEPKYEYIVPDTNGQKLAQLVCPRRD